jgi:carboxylesterase type B
MPSAQLPHGLPAPKLFHTSLQTTFYGVNHPLSTEATPIHQYLGVKYASVPARFRQSRLLKTYPSVVDASTPGPICPQPRNSRSFEEALLGIADDVSPKQNLVFDEFECLNLNITCPAGLTPQSHVPVMLWIHGGGDRGSGSSWVYDCGPLVRKSLLMGRPVIMVTMNFRIGLFGFAASATIREDNHRAGDEGCGNYGLRDQRIAMEWLFNNIAEFGGDPNNITLFGNSTGGGDVLCHLLSSDNQIRPRFQRAIVQSPVFDPNLPNPSNAGWHLNRMFSPMLITSVEQLRAIEPEKLAAIAYGQLASRAVDDGHFFRHDWKESFTNKTDSQTGSCHLVPEHVSRTISRTPTGFGSNKSKSRSRSNYRSTSTKPGGHHTSGYTLALPATLQPLLIGDCGSDAHLWSLPISLWTPSAAVRRIKAVCQSLALTNNLLRGYDICAHTPEDEIMDRILELVNDARVAWPTHIVANNMKAERGGRGVWRYVFDQEAPGNGIPHHAVDLLYLFDTVPRPEVTSSGASDGASEADLWCDSFSDVDEDEHGPDTLYMKHKMTFSDEEPSPLASPQLSPEPLDFDINIPSTPLDPSGKKFELDEAWGIPVVDEWAYNRVRDAIQEKWIGFAHGEAPWREDKVFVFGPEGETGERSTCIFEGRRRKSLWKEVLEPLGMALVQKVGLELSRGPPISTVIGPSKTKY